MDKNVDAHNIGEERYVASFNYASTVGGGGEFLESGSRHFLVKSSTDLFENVSPGEFRKFRNQSADIQEIKAKWKEKGYKEKELLNLRNEQKRLNDLRFLKEQEIKGPFSCAEDVKRFMDSCE